MIHLYDMLCFHLVFSFQLLAADIRTLIRYVVWPVACQEGVSVQEDDETRPA